MALFTEDVIIKILTDSTQGVREIKKVDKELKTMGAQAKISSKDLLTVGAAFGGISAAIDIGVKAVTNYVEKIKTASDEYIKLAKESGDYYSEAIDAIDRLDSAEANLNEARARRADEDLTGAREFLALRKETKAFDIAFAETITFFQKQLEATGLDIDLAFIQAQERARAYIDTVSSYESGNEFTKDAEGAADALERSLELLKEQQDAIDKYNKANESVEAQLLRLKNATDQVGFSGSELLEIQRQQAIELIKLDEYYKDHQDVLIAATDEYYNQRIELEKMNERRARAIADLEAYNDLVDAIFEQAESAPDPFVTWDDSLNNALIGLNSLANAMTGFLDIAFTDNKAAAKASAVINTALAVTNALANIPFPFNIPAAAVMLARGVKEQQNIDETFKAALGTPPDGYVVPPGFEGDNFPVMAQSGETVKVTPQGQGGGETFDFTLIIDSAVIARITNQQISNRKINIRTSDLIA